MQIQLIRSATLRLHYGGHLFIIDPFLAAKETLRSFAGNGENPTIDLPCTPEEAIADVEMVIISHLHVDHFDGLAAELLPKNLPVFCQPGDEGQIAEKGFVDVTAVTHQTTWHNISLTRTTGQHGSGDWAVKMGNVSGFILQADNEPTVYWMGDTIWYDVVAEVVKQVQPDIIITHSSGAKFGDSDPIVMDAAQTVAVCQAAPQATVVAVHLESLDHGTVTRADLRATAVSTGISNEQLLIPADGESIFFKS
jgi:L-ascorbate metabolism protein UlaG (beta-lactamase superfamily)